MRREVKVDTNLAELYDKRAKAHQDVHSATDSMHYAVNDRRVYLGRIPTWKMTLDEVTSVAVDPNTYEGKRYAEARSRYLLAVEQVKYEQRNIDQTEKLYTGWSRFFLVANTNGHIHSSMHCSTCFPTTHYSWLPTLSGLTEADAVMAHGPRLCSVCFPTAPVEWTVGIVSDKAYCVGSGKDAKTHRRYAKCTDCGKVVGVTTLYGNFRKHEAKG